MNSSQLEMLKALQDLEIVDMTKVYLAVGFIFITQIGTMMGVLIGVFKIYGKVVEWKTNVENVTEQNKKDVNEAHGKIRNLEERFMRPWLS